MILPCFDDLAAATGWTAAAAIQSTSCDWVYGRRSNSIDVTKKMCEACRPPIAYLGKFNKDGTPAKVTFQHIGFRN